MIYVCALSDLSTSALALSDFRLLTLLSPMQEAEMLKQTPRRSLHLAFHDICEPRAGLVAPSTEMVSAILDFGSDHASPLLIHCWAGISRSSAAAYMIVCATSPGNERDVALELRRRAPFATPNRLMVRLADDLLRRNGRMVAAIDAIGRGAEAFAGTPYTMPPRWPL